MSERRFTVRWTESAKRDLGDIVAHIAVEAPRSAHRVLNRIRDAAARLITYPHRGRLVPELRGLGLHSHREIICNPYRIVFQVVNDHVIVHAVLDGRRDLEDLLYERLTRPE